jgi:hypothetical protein
MTVLETTAVVHNHRVLIDIAVPDSVVDGTRLRVTVAPVQAPANDDLPTMSIPPNPYPNGSGAAILFALHNIHPDWKGSSREEVAAWQAEVAEDRGFEDEP